MTARRRAALTAVLVAAVLPIALASSLSRHVPRDGVITVPKNYQTEWTLLGTWSIADKEKAGAAGLHYVYTQPETVQSYRENGEFPDGAVLVKELRKANTSQLNTGTASWSSEIEGWFVMIRDREDRFSGNALWGDGWGWAFFAAGDPDKTTTKDYRAECIGCHIPAKGDDWVYVRAYPVLTEK